MKTTNIAHAFKWLLCYAVTAGLLTDAFAADEPVIFPLPQEISLTGASFEIDDKVRIIVPDQASDNDFFLARFLVGEISDKYGIALRVKPSSQLSDHKPYILMGTIHNPLIKKYCDDARLRVTVDSPGPEGYVLQVTKEFVLVVGSDERGAFYGLQSLRQLVQKDDIVKIQGVNVRDWPATSFRGIRLYIPGGVA